VSFSKSVEVLFLVALATNFVVGCASSEQSDGLEEEVSANQLDTSGGGDLDLESIEVPGESQPSLAMPKPDREVLNPEIDQSILLAPSDAAIARAAKEMAKADEERAQALGEENLAAFEDAEAGTGLKPRKSYGGGGGGTARVPKIPGAALQKKGALLNRFYFVREGDTPESVSTLIYGSGDRGKDLVKWNGGGWRAGKLVYYASPLQAEDTEMRSFYQERNVPPEEYSIQAGDSLFKVAKAKLGNNGSWKEIAVINGFSKVEKLEPGTRIALYPADLKPFSAAASNNGYRRNAIPPTNPTPTAVAQSQPSEAPQESVPPVTSKAKKSPSKLNIGSLIEQNLFTLVLGGGIFVLLLLLMALSKQKKKKKTLPGLDDFNEDLGPKKSKRKSL